MKEKKKIGRREFLKVAGTGAAVTTAALYGCKPRSAGSASEADGAQQGQMTYRTNPKTGDRVSLLGYGCMRWPTVSSGSARDSGDEIDQEMVNALVDHAIAHGVNYFDTSPAYCRGHSEHATGVALRRHPRDKYFIATKLSNFAPSTWSREASMAMYRNSFRELQVDYIDYLLLHGVGIKVANCVALFAYGRMECAPVDVWIQRVIDQHYAGQTPFPAYGNAGILQQWMFYFARSEKERVK